MGAKSRRANTALGIGAAIAGGIPAFLNSYYQAKSFGQREKEAALKEKLGMAQLDIDRQNVGLRGQELGYKREAEGGRNVRHGENMQFKYFDKFAGANAAQAPEEYGQGLGAQAAGDPEFTRMYEAARVQAMKNRVGQTAREAGARSSAAASAKSRQLKKDRAEQFETREALKNKTALPKEPFYPSQERTITEETTNRRVASGLASDSIRRLRKQIEEEGTVDPQLFVAAGERLAKILGRDLDDNEVADELGIPSEERAELFQAVDEIKPMPTTQTSTTP